MAKSYTLPPAPAVGNDNEILMYLHCAKCIEEKPAGVTPKDWQRTQTGWTKHGLQVWCNRHNCNIVNIDFEGACHPANTFTKEQTDRLVPLKPLVTVKQTNKKPTKKGRNKS